MRSRLLAYPLASLLCCTASGAALAQSSASGSFSLSSEDGASADGETSGDGDADSRLKPKANLFELGFFGGMFFPSEDHNLRTETTEQIPYDSPSLELGLRLAYFPLKFLGVEGEGAVMPSGTDDGESAGLWALRAHLVAQYPEWRLTPFAVLGMGALGGDSDTMGSDADPAVHFGIGAKYAFDDFVSARLDLRDNLTQKVASSQGSQTHHPEVLLGLTFTLGRAEKAKEAEAPADSDSDGIPDAEDKCPDQVGDGSGGAEAGCPNPDPDGDSVPLELDKCPNVAGVAPDGCPPPDTDGDGFNDAEDKCPEEAGVAPDGCPDPDPDKDGLVGEADKCPQEPETKNGYQDKDGCPDEMPEKVKAFSGVMEGIEFDTGRATIRWKSRATLDKVATDMNEFPKVRVLIIGHTDSDGDRDANVTLSQQRADSVKAYLVKKGVAGDRIETKGAGPDSPIADNDTPEGKQKNRRIEFKLID